MPRDDHDARADVQDAAVQGDQQGEGWRMRGRDGGNVTDRDRPVPFFLTDHPIPFRATDLADLDPRGWVP